MTVADEDALPEEDKERSGTNMMGKEKASQEEIYRVMRADIEAGGYPASSRLPSVRTLAKRFSASPNTISKVVSRLMESGLCTARRGVGLFVRSLPNRKLTLLVGSTSEQPRDDFYGDVERRIKERCQADGIEIERYHIAAGDPPYGPDIDRIRRPGRVILCIGLSHEPHLKQLADLRRPMLVIGCAPCRCTASSVVPHSFRSGYLAARHLIRKGCRRIAFIGRMREVRGVHLPEAESLKELAGVQCAFMEDGLQINGELVFSDISQVQTRASSLKDMPDAVIMPDSEGVETIQALKALGTKLERVVIGDDRILERQKRPAAVVIKREEVVEHSLQELHRLLDEQSKAHRAMVIDGELHDALGGA
jgi:DNA-binding LacI/PurR family transcriptional regulator